MKINVLLNNVQDVIGLKKCLDSSKLLLSNIGYNISFDYNFTSKQFSSIPLNSDVVRNGYQVNPNEIVSEMKPGYDITCLFYDWSFIFPHPTNPCTNNRPGDVPMQIPVQFYTDFTSVPHMTFSDSLVSFFLHEFSHYVHYERGVPDLTHKQYDIMWSGQFSQKSNIDYYLFLLKKLKPMQTYKYFKDSEIVGLKPELVAKLDAARDIAGVPFSITSGYRTPAQNALVGGVQDSAHETGLAVDLAVKDSVSGGKMLLALTQVGFKRFGFYSDNHIHVDIDISKPNPCYWIK